MSACATKETDVSKVEKAPRPIQEKSAAQKDGKYYKDDGPPEVDEVDWRTVPNPEVVHETIHPGYNRPYEVFGTRYVPFDTPVRYRKQGMASWYGRRYHGRKTSSGEVYDMYGMTAAHTVLPIPSYVRVTRVDDGRSIIVRVNDRGPFLNDRLIDLSYTAARKLGVVDTGTAEVVVESILPEDLVASKQPVAKVVQQDDVPKVKKPQKKGSKQKITDSSNYLQLGAFSSPTNATNFADKLVLPTTLTISNIEVKAVGDLHRVLIGPYPDRDIAEGDLEQLQDAGLEALLKQL